MLQGVELEWTVLQSVFIEVLLPLLTEPLPLLKVLRGVRLGGMNRGWLLLQVANQSSSFVWGMGLWVF